MEQERVKQMLAEANVVIDGSHFVYVNGGHGSAYVNKDAVYPSPGLVAELCDGIAQHFREQGIVYETVIGPEKGGIILAQWTAHHSFTGFHALGLKDEINAVYAEKVGKNEDGDVFALTRGYDRFVTDQRVLIVEDVLTTGSSVRKVAKLVTGAGGLVVGAGGIYNRGDVTAAQAMVTYLFTLVDEKQDMWPAEECPLCAANVPMNIKLGNGHQWFRSEAGRVWLRSGGSVAA